jgi:hypothetical protein
VPNVVFDFNNAPEQRGDFTPIPPGIYPGTIVVKPGTGGHDGVLTRSSDGKCEMLNVEFVVDEGEHQKRKIFERFVMRGTDDGHAKAAEISYGRLRALIEGARGIRRDDTSPEATKARTVNSLMELHGLRVLAQIDIEPERTDSNTGKTYPPRNSIKAFITPDRIDWRPLTQYPQSPPDVGSAPPPGSNGPTPPPPAGALERPQWAR